MLYEPACEWCKALNYAQAHPLEGGRRNDIRIDPRRRDRGTRTGHIEIVKSLESGRSIRNN
jgi:hypothetical protein